MNTERTIGNLLLLALMVLSFLFFHFMLDGSGARAFEAGILLLVFLLFYFLGKSIGYSYANAESGRNPSLVRFLIIAAALLPPLLLASLYMSVHFDARVLLAASLVLGIGYDYRGFMDKALENQLYRELALGHDRLAVWMGLYAVLAIALLAFFPLLLSSE